MLSDSARGGTYRDSKDHPICHFKIDGIWVVLPSLKAVTGHGRETYNDTSPSPGGTSEMPAVPRGARKAVPMCADVTPHSDHCLSRP